MYSEFRSIHHHTNSLIETNQKRIMLSDNTRLLKETFWLQAFNNFFQILYFHSDIYEHISREFDVH